MPLNSYNIFMIVPTDTMGTSFNRILILHVNSAINCDISIPRLILCVLSRTQVNWLLSEKWGFDYNVSVHIKTMQLSASTCYSFFIVAFMNIDPTTNSFYFRGNNEILFTLLLSIKMSNNYGLTYHLKWGLANW